jgi:hypothetical protein
MVTFDREQVLKISPAVSPVSLIHLLTSNFQRRAIQTTYSYLVPTDYVEGEESPFYDLQWNSDKWDL